MLVKQLSNGSIEVNLWWRSTSFRVSMYLCRNQSRSLEAEVNYRRITPDKPIAIIPVNTVNSILELLQGAVHYKLYSNRIRRVKNKGLVLALLCTGEKQLERLISTLETAISAGLDYYVVAVDTELENRESCFPLGLEQRKFSELNSNDLSKLVKNVEALFALL